ncbi:NRDE family protein, partial [bacterium]|nr:NRDE family protein [bacterium]
WAVLTNISTDKPGSRSRGHLVVDYLAGRWDAPPNVEEFGGFNLLLGRQDRVDYYSSHAPHQALSYGRYSLSNLPWGASCPRAQRALYCENLEDLAIRTHSYGIRSFTWLTIADLITIEERTYPSLNRRRIQVELDNRFRPN